MIRLKKIPLMVMVSLATIVSCHVSCAFGSGFGIFTQGASAMGQANAVVAHPDGPSAVFFNPAMMTRLPGTQAEIGTTLIFPNRDYTAPDGSTASTRDTVFTPSTFYLTHAFNDKLSAGLGVFNPFGLGTDWGANWQGRYIATRSELTTWNINPVAAYRICPGLSVAAGLDIVLLDARLENKIPTPLGDVSQKFTGDGNGIGYNIGVLLDAGKGVTIGASYRSEVKIDVNGNADFGVPSPLLGGTFPNTGGKTSITLPQQVSAGIGYQATDKLVIEAGMRWEDWSSFSEQQFIFAQPVAGSSIITIPRDWHSTFAVNAGGKYRINDMFSMMIGYLYGWNPVPDSTFEPAIPDSNTHLFCIGGEARLDGLTVALGYVYQLQEERDKNNSIGAFAGLPPATEANGRYSSDIHLVGMSVGYKF